jgi:hypothetical protein
MHMQREDAMANKRGKWTAAKGDGGDDKDRNLTDIIGSKNDDKLTDKVKTANYGQLMAHYGWVPPDGTIIPNPQFSDKDWDSLVDAIQKETGWTYHGHIRSCCSCWP